ncbi:MAG: ABC transporter ATP-binding protein [Chloroflexota bacterium]|nr:MAG: ABC transporter ATP-binding protein [Chloroflexota bacterium]
MDPVLELRDLVVQFYTQDGVVYAVNGVSYAAGAGETLGIVGESGCGKSVSVLSIMRLIPEPPGKIVSGEILYMGQDLLKLSKTGMQDIRGKEIAMVFQDPMTSFNPVLTIGQQISESSMVHMGLDKEEAKKRSVELLELVGIPKAAERINDYPHQFSGGMRQRAMIAMALSCNPSVLIADEPTTALDVTIQAQIVELIKSLSERFNMAIIWITHDLGVIAEIADRVAVMYAGYVVEEADVFTLFEQPSHPYTLLLLKALPRIDSYTSEKLATIPGSPPDCLSLPPGCPFAPRCDFIVERCLQENPSLQEIAPQHKIACWVDVTSGSER